MVLHLQDGGGQRPPPIIYYTVNVICREFRRKVSLTFDEKSRPYGVYSYDGRSKPDYIDVETEMKRQQKEKIIKICRTVFLQGMSTDEIAEALNPLVEKRSVERYVEPIREMIGTKKSIKVLK